jgi:hypothetical protein
MAEMYSYSDSEQRETVHRIPPLFRQLERFDYETMSWRGGPPTVPPPPTAP